jgi:hypothetical protein
LILDAGAVLNPTTANPVIQAKPSAVYYSHNINISGGSIVCNTGACQSGIGLDIGVASGKVSNMSIRGFTSNHAIVIEGANTLVFDNMIVASNQDGFFLAPYKIASQNFAPNAIKIINSSIGNNTGWGIIGQRTSYSGPAVSELCLNNSYLNNLIEANGKGSSGGGILDVCAVGLTISGNYFEGNVSNNIVLGQQSGRYAGNVEGVSILNNYFTVASNVPNTITFGGAPGGTSNTVIGNTEFGTPASGGCFVNDGFDNGQPTILSNTTVSPKLFCGAPNSLLMGKGVIGFPIPVIARGTQSVAGCSLSNPVGGAAAGQFAAGTTSCTVTITPGITAPHGFYCSAQDLTTPTNVVTETATTATTCTIAGTVGNGDTIVWQVGYAY